MKQIIIIFLSVILLTNCKSLKFSDLRPTGEIKNKLPALEPQINIRSLESTYSLGTTNSRGTAYTQASPLINGFVSVGNGSSTSYADPRVQDAITLFERDIKDNITNSLGKNVGYITFNIAAGTSRSKFMIGNFVISAVTGWLPYLCGMTLSQGITTLDIEVEVKDNSGNTVGRYNAFSSVKKPVALWRGYSKADAIRLSNIECVKDCLNQIKTQIERDSSNLKLQSNNM
jgi:hypothetical protein